MAREMTLLEFQASGKHMHYDALPKEVKEGWADGLEGHHVMLYSGGPCLALGDDGTAWFEDYKERFTGPFRDIERKFYEFLFCENSLPIVV